VADQFRQWINDQLECGIFFLLPRKERNNFWNGIHGSGFARQQTNSGVLVKSSPGKRRKRRGSMITLACCRPGNVGGVFE